MSPSQQEIPETIVLKVNQGGDAAASPINVNRVDIEAPWRWLEAGWRDLVRMPRISLAYGAIFAIVAMALLYGLSYAGMQSLILALAGGFLLVGPVLAVGLYEGSRRLAAGEPVALGDVLLAGLRAPGQLALLGFALMFIYLAWLELAFLMFMMFFGDRPFPPLDDFVPRLLYTWQGLTLLITGTIVGAVLAALTFAISAVSAPMLGRRGEVGVATAIATSVTAVRFNFQPMALWAALIAVIMATGIASFFVGLVVAFPLIGHATWHAYRDLIGGQE